MRAEGGLTGLQNEEREGCYQCNRREPVILAPALLLCLPIGREGAWRPFLDAVVDRYRSDEGSNREGLYAPLSRSLLCRCSAMRFRRENPHLESEMWGTRIG
jgi:hypothetical protein